MKTLIVEASPRREGNSITIARSFMRGLRDGGETQIREYVLNEMDVRPCLGCWKCLEMSEHGLRDRGMADDGLWTRIASMLKEEGATKDR